MEMISIVEKDEKGQIQGGMKFWHSPGDKTYLYHYWEHMASGPVFSDIMPDPVATDPEGKMSALEYTVRESWIKPNGELYKDIHKHDKDFC